MLADLAERGLDRGDDRRDDDVGDLAGGEAVHLKEVDEEDAVLVGGLVVVGGDAPVGGELGPGIIELVEAENRVGVADVECEQHGVLSLYLPGRLRRRGDRRCGR